MKNYRDAFNFSASTGILFNHESPRKDEQFVLRKISTAVAKIKLGLQKKVILGDIKSKRDWGHAKDYAYAMWLINQQKKPSNSFLGGWVGWNTNSKKSLAYLRGGVVGQK